MKIKISAIFALILLISCSLFAEVITLENGLKVTTTHVNSDKSYITVILDYSSYDEYIPYDWLPEEWKQVTWLPDYGLPIPGIRQALVNSFSLGFTKDPWLTFLDLGGTIAFSSTPDFIYLTAVVPKENTADALKNIFTILTRTPNTTVAISSISNVKSFFQNNNTSIKMAFSDIFGSRPYGMFYGNDTSYLDMINGTLVTIVHESVVKPSRATISVVSGLEEQNTKKSIETTFSAWQDKKNMNWERIPSDIFTHPEKSKTNIIELDNFNTPQYLCTFLVSHLDSEIYPLAYVMTALLEGIGGELFYELRVKNQLTYNYFVNIFDNKEGFLINISVDISEHNFFEVSEIMHEITNKFAEEGLSEEKLTRAKNYAITKLLTDSMEPSALSYRNAKELFYFNTDIFTLETIEKIHGVSAADIQHFAKNYMEVKFETVLIPHLKETREIGAKE